MNSERRKALLASVLVVLLAFWGYRLLRSMLGGDSATPLIRGAAGRAETASALPEVLELRLSDLELNPAEFRIGRDPFRFAAVSPPPPPPKKPEQRKPVREARVAAPQQGIPGKPKPPPVDVVFLGSFGPEGRRIAVFSDGTDIYNVLKGGILKKNFRVDKIGFESADLKFVDFPDEPPQRLAAGG